MSEELKPCPFYNHDMPIVERVLDGRDRLLGIRWVVMCGTCGCTGRSGETREKAGEYWNIRAYEIMEEAQEKMQRTINEYLRCREGAIAMKKTIETCFKMLDSSIKERA